MSLIRKVSNDKEIFQESEDDVLNIIKKLRDESFGNEEQRKRLIDLLSTLMTVKDSSARKLFKMIGNALTDIGNSLIDNYEEPDEFEDEEDHDEYEEENNETILYVEDKPKVYKYKSKFSYKEGYQGYKNFETWNICLWMFNDETVYKLMTSEKPFTAESAEEFTMLTYPNGTPDMKGSKNYNKVNWYEVANCFNEE